ncbi:MAG: RHS repeat-associated core domain-containing protein [Bacteroidales bacterium]|nr:RHS repeat-associated core domain-containing protein [Bacteroidales bacterium]
MNQGLTLTSSTTFFSLAEIYAFSAKERDVETGLSYFGARYYSSDLSIWMSVDPMSDKYPSLSPYVYCADNPVRLVDPDGEEVIFLNEAARKKVNALIDKNSPDYNKAYARKFKILDNSRTKYCFKEVEGDGKTNGIVSPNSDENIMVLFSEGGGRTSTRCGFSKKYATLFEETFHAVDFEKGRLNLGKSTCRDEARAWKFATKAPGTSFRCGPNNKDLSLANCFRSKSITSLARILHDGYTGTIFDVFGRAHEYIIHEMNDKTKGLYHNKPIK